MNQIHYLKAHISINVQNINASVAFYQKMFGIEPLKVRPGYAKFDVQNPPLNLALNEHPVKERDALSHLGLQVATIADVFALRERWQAEGLITRDEMNTSCCYAIQDKTWVADPDGNAWEAFVVLQDQLAKTAETTGCCVITSSQPACGCVYGSCLIVHPQS